MKACGPWKVFRRSVFAAAMLVAVCPPLAAEPARAQRDGTRAETTPPESTPPESAKPAATDTVNALHGTFLDVMKRADELGFDGRFAELSSVIEGTFDLEFMALKTIGEGRKQLGELDRARWVASFGKFLLANYARRFDGWSGQSFESLVEEPAPRNTVVVRTRLIRPNDDDVKLDYRLRPTGSGWRIIDIYSNGNVSELALRRSEFSSLFREVGLDQLIASVDAKAARR